MPVLNKGYSFGGMPHEEIMRPLYEALHLARGKKTRAKIKEAIAGVQRLQALEIHKLCDNATLDQGGDHEARK